MPQGQIVPRLPKVTPCPPFRQPLKKAQLGDQGSNESNFIWFLSLLTHMICFAFLDQNFLNFFLIRIQRYRIFFFFPEKIKGYSLTRFGHFLFFFISGFVFFFRPCFFFPRKSLHATHSTEKNLSAKKRSKNGKKWYFLSISSFSVVFFFSANFFFSRKNLAVTHSLDFRGRKKKTALEKKTAFSLTHSKNRERCKF